MFHLRKAKSPFVLGFDNLDKPHLGIGRDVKIAACYNDDMPDAEIVSEDQVL